MTYFNNKNYKKSNKIIKAIVTLILLYIASVLLPYSIDAITMGSWNGSLTSGMPTDTSNSITGYFPQGISSGGIAFCNDQSSMVRWGEKDNEIYYAEAKDYDNFRTKFSLDSAIDDLKGYANAVIKGDLDDLDIPSENRDKGVDSSDNTKTVDKPKEYPESVTVVWTNEIGQLYGDLTNPFLFVVDFAQEGEDTGAVTEASLRFSANLSRNEVLKKIFSRISREEKPQDLLEGYDSEVRDYPDYEGGETQGDVQQGPQVAIIGEGATSIYSSTESNKSIDTRTSTSFADIMNAYIYTGEYHKGRQNKTPYNLIDIQVANWLQNDDNHNFGSCELSMFENFVLYSDIPFKFTASGVDTFYYYDINDSSNIYGQFNTTDTYSYTDLYLTEFDKDIIIFDDNDFHTISKLVLGDNIPEEFSFVYTISDYLLCILLVIVISSPIAIIIKVLRW